MSIPGFDRAQRAWENMEPSYDAECECPAEDDLIASCPKHGWCTGCYDRRCEDCAE